MSDEPEIVGRARTQYSDWTGTVAFDNPDYEDDLYALFKLDKEEWFIVGFAITGTYNDAGGASAYAIERAKINSFDDWARIAEENDGRIPVKEFALDRTSIAGMQVLFRHKRWAIRAFLRSSIDEPGFELEVVTP